MSRSGAEIRASAAESKLIQDRMTATENHLGQICETLSSYTRKTAHLRDKGDDIAKTLARYADYETMNLTMKKALTDFAENFSAVQDYRQAEVTRLEAKVVEPLSNYGLLCKQTKNELKATFASRDKEINQKKKVEKIRQKNPNDRHQITQAERELQKASVEATRTEKILEQQMDTFETKKVEDIKKSLSNFINIEMVFHAKALELYTKCFQSLVEIDPAKDVEEFKKKVHPSDNSSSRMIIARSASDASLNSSKSPSIGSNKTPSINSNKAPSVNSTTTPSINSNKTPSINSNKTPSINSNRTPPINSKNAASNHSMPASQQKASNQNSQQNSPARTPIKVESKVQVEDLEYDDDDSEYEDDDEYDSEYEETEADTSRTDNVRK